VIGLHRDHGWAQPPRIAHEGAGLDATMRQHCVGTPSGHVPGDCLIAERFCGDCRSYHGGSNVE
jgi:hypothetical protein